MTTLFHSIILATCAAATVAVGIASAGVYGEHSGPAAKKADRLAIVKTSTAPQITVEERLNGVSILTRLPAPSTSQEL
jgi:hypothetical protein